MRIALLCSVLFCTSCGMEQVISESRRILSATAESVEEVRDAVRDVKSGEFDWDGLIAGIFGGAVAGGGGGFLVGRNGRKRNGS